MVVDGIVWWVCGLGLLLILVATVAVWSAAVLAGQDDRRLEKTRLTKKIGRNGKGSE